MSTRQRQTAGQDHTAGAGRLPSTHGALNASQAAFPAVPSASAPQPLRKNPIARRPPQSKADSRKTFAVGCAASELCAPAGENSSSIREQSSDPSPDPQLVTPVPPPPPPPPPPMICARRRPSYANSARVPLSVVGTRA